MRIDVSRGADQDGLVDTREEGYRSFISLHRNRSRCVSSQLGRRSRPVSTSAIDPARSHCIARPLPPVREHASSSPNDTLARPIPGHFFPKPRCARQLQPAALKVHSSMVQLASCTPSVTPAARAVVAEPWELATARALHGRGLDHRVRSIRGQDWPCGRSRRPCRGLLRP